MSMKIRASSSNGRDLLIEATLSCLAETGNQGATVRSIAHVAGVTPGLVRYHFKSKNALLIAAYQTFNEEIYNRLNTVDLNQNRSLKSVLADSMRAYFPEDLTDTRKMRIMVAFWEQVLTNPDFSRVQKQSVNRIQQFFARLVANYLGNSKTSDRIAIGMISIADGLWLECCLNPDRMKPKVAIEIATIFSLTRIQSGLATT